MSISTAIGRLETIVIFRQELVEGPIVNVVKFLEDFIKSDGFYRFHINPNNLKVSKGKITAKVLTKAGYERSYQGNDLTVLNYSGTTGYFKVPDAFLAAGIDDVRLSFLWQKFRRLERFFEKEDGDLWLIYKLRIYKGSMTKFDYTEDAEQPWHIRYSFTFEALTDTPMGEDRLGKNIIDLASLDSITNELGVGGKVASDLLNLV
jgi:hypothetical protein